MKRYVILFLFLLNITFVFHQSKIEVMAGMEVKAQSNGDESGYFLGWTTDDFVNFINSEEFDDWGITGNVWSNAADFINNTEPELLLSMLGVSLDPSAYATGDGAYSGYDTDGSASDQNIRIGSNVLINLRDENGDGEFDKVYYFGPDGTEIVQTISNSDPLTEDEDFLAWYNQNYEPSVTGIITDDVLIDYYNDLIFLNDYPTTTEAEDPTLDPDGGKNPFVSDIFPPTAKAEADFVKNTLNANADVSGKCIQLKNYSQSNTYEYGISVNIVNGVYSVYVNNQGQTLQTQYNTSTISMSYASNAVINAHNHTTPSPMGIQSFSSQDIKNFCNYYKFCKNNGGDYKASVVYLPNNGEAMAYVDSKEKLNKFLETAEGKVFLNKGFSDQNSKIGEKYDDVRKELIKEGYSKSTAQRYAFTYTLDYFQTGINLFYKEPGTTDFKLQSIQIETTTIVPALIVNGVELMDEYKIINYKPIISK